MGTEPTLDACVSMVNHRLHFRYRMPWPFPVWVIRPQPFLLWRKLHNFFNTLGHLWACKQSLIVRTELQSFSLILLLHLQNFSLLEKITKPGQIGFILKSTETQKGPQSCWAWLTFTRRGAQPSSCFRQARILSCSSHTNPPGLETSADTFVLIPQENET